jgi:hypothetical protein
MATLTVDFFSSLDGNGSAHGWPGYWGKEGPELRDYLVQTLAQRLCSAGLEVSLQESLLERGGVPYPISVRRSSPSPGRGQPSRGVDWALNAYHRGHAFLLEESPWLPLALLVVA